jgi:hypothetical protein
MNISTQITAIADKKEARRANVLRFKLISPASSTGTNQPFPRDSMLASKQEKAEQLAVGSFSAREAWRQPG